MNQFFQGMFKFKVYTLNAHNYKYDKEKQSLILAFMKKM